MKRRNPSALAVARRDPFGRVAVPMLAAGIGSAAGIVAARPLGKKPMLGGILGALAGVATYLVVDLVDQRR